MTAKNNSTKTILRLREEIEFQGLPSPAAMREDENRRVDIPLDIPQTGASLSLCLSSVSRPYFVLC